MKRFYLLGTALVLLLMFTACQQTEKTDEAVLYSGMLVGVLPGGGEGPFTICDITTGEYTILGEHTGDHGIINVSANAQGTRFAYELHGGTRSTSPIIVEDVGRGIVAELGDDGSRQAVRTDVYRPMLIEGGEKILYCRRIYNYGNESYEYVLHDLTDSSETVIDSGQVIDLDKLRLGQTEVNELLNEFGLLWTSIDEMGDSLAVTVGTGVYKKDTGEIFYMKRLDRDKWAYEEIGSYLTSENVATEIWRYDCATGEKSLYYRVGPVLNMFGLDISPDGESLLIGFRDVDFSSKVIELSMDEDDRLVENPLSIGTPPSAEYIYFADLFYLPDGRMTYLLSFRGQDVEEPQRYIYDPVDDSQELVEFIFDGELLPLKYVNKIYE